ncbi:MAG: acyl carrier protein [Bryobacteraceae bacterium]|nr:acyl carrier protein [Bryobacteraceae bacterium]
MNTLEMKQIVAEAMAQIAPEADLNSVPGGANLRETLDIDSFDFLNLLIELGKRLKIEIPEADYGRLGTLDSLAVYLAERAQT